MVRTWIALAAALMAATVGAAPPSPEGAATWRTVVRVIDGDTIDHDQGERVRLIGVDTPETKHPQKPVEYFGREATEFTRRMVEGKRVRLEFDWQRKDKYGRTLAYVFLADGTFLNAEIIKQGYGHAYTQFPFKYLEEFRALEREARERGVGLWAPSAGPSPPKSEASKDVTPAPNRPAPVAVIGPSDRWSCPAAAPIKGNLTTRTGECIYHVPGGQYYARAKPERCFTSESEAAVAGCRRSMR